MVNPQNFKSLNDLNNKTVLLREIQQFKSKNYRIAIDHAKEINSGKTTTYTFTLVPKSAKDQNPELYNIVFIKHADEHFSIVGVRYNFSDKQAESFRKTDRFTGKTHVVFFAIKGFQNQAKFSKRIKKTGYDNPCNNTGTENCITLGAVHLEFDSDNSGGHPTIDLPPSGPDSGFGDFPSHNDPIGGGGSSGGGGKSEPVGINDNDDKEKEKLQEVIIDSTFEEIVHPSKVLLHQ